MNGNALAAIILSFLAASLFFLFRYAMSDHRNGFWGWAQNIGLTLKFLFLSIAALMILITVSPFFGYCWVKDKLTKR